jgi:hypothetical protein
MQYSFSKFFSMQVWFGCFLIKGRERGKKRVWRQVCEWLSVAVAFLPAAVSLLLLEALFMQISGVSLTLTWSRRLCLLRVLLCVSLCYKLSPFQAHWGRWHCTHFLRAACLFTAHVGSGSSLLSCGVFLPLPLSQAFLLLVAGRGLFIYSSVRDSPPPLFGAQGAPPSLLHVFIVHIAYYSVSLFLSGWGSVCPGGYAEWPRVVCGSTAVPISSPCLLLSKPSGCRRLVARGPSWFLCSTWSGDALRQLEVWRSQSFASSR